MNPSSTVESPLVAKVQSMYAAFARGDIPALLAGLSDEVDWRLNVDPAAPGAKEIPDFRSFRGKAGVQAFFSIIGTELEFHSFQPISFLSGRNEVAVRVNMDVTVRSTSRRVRLESVHLFSFDAAGRVTAFREFLDTLAVAASWDTIRAKA